MKRLTVVLGLIVVMLGSMSGDRGVEAQDVSTPVATPAPKPVPLTIELDLLYYYFSDSEDGGTMVRAEVVNKSDAGIDAPVLEFLLLDGEGNILDTVRARSAFPVIAPGSTMGLAGYTEIGDVSVGEWTDETFDMCAGGDLSDFATDPTYSGEGLQIEGVEVLDGDPKSLDLRGAVKNLTAEPLEFVTVWVDVRREDGTWVGNISEDIDVAIPPSRSARFQISRESERFGMTRDELSGTVSNVRVTREGTLITMC